MASGTIPLLTNSAHLKGGDVYVNWESTLSGSTYTVELTCYIQDPDVSGSISQTSFYVNGGFNGSVTTLYPSKTVIGEYTLFGVKSNYYGKPSEGITVTVTFCSYEDVVKNHDTGRFVYQTAKNFAERYPDFIDLEYINIITKAKYVYIFKKDSFTLGNAEDFIEFLKSKGIKIQK